MNEVTRELIIAALKNTDSNGMTEKEIAKNSRIDTTSENLMAIKDELIEMNHPYVIYGDTKFWRNIEA